MEEEEETRARLQTLILDAVKACQTRFGGRNELATELDPSVVHLCSCLERVLTHGLKPNKPTILDLVRNGNDGQKYSFWDVIDKLLTPHEKQRYEMLRQVWTDRGRARSWLRSSLNERSLERYFNALQTINLRKYYETYAFLLNQESISVLLNVAAGLSSILFALSIDRPELNSLNAEERQNNAVSFSETVIEDVPEKIKKEDGNSRKIVAKIISFGDDELIEETPQGEASPNENVEVECAVEATGMADLDLSNSDSESKDSTLQRSDSGLRPLNSTMDELIPVTAGEEAHSSEDSLSIPSFTEEADTSTGSGNSSKTDLNLKVESLQEKCALLASQLTQLSVTNKEKQSQQEQKINELNRENELLKNQLRKYVNAVQMLKKDGSEFEGAELYQQKLVQVAEMHGELMELNDRFQRTMVAQESIIKRLYMELEAIRGPLLGPTEIEITSSQIISLWIPSVFLTGAHKRHHVYQVHLRIGNEEWNVYRRYSQFYSHYNQYRKLHPIASAFQFPPKKTIGNKGEKFVEERRLKLQQYLRRLLNHTVANSAQLVHSPTKARLIAALPFFGELSETPMERNVRALTAPLNSPHYSGL